MQVSIILVNWNTSALLPPLLDDVEKDLRNLEAEIILVDNASSDFDSSLLPSLTHPISILRNTTNLGFAKACNQASTIARGKYLLFCNPDIRLSVSGQRSGVSSRQSAVDRQQTGGERKIEAMFQMLESYSSLAVLGPQLVHENGRLQNSAAPFPSLGREFLPRFLLKLLFPRKYQTKFRTSEFRIQGPGVRDQKEPLTANSQPPTSDCRRSTVDSQLPTSPIPDSPTPRLPDSWVPVESVIGAFLMISKEHFHELGGFDEDYFFTVEETDLCYRARQKGYECGILPGVHVIHQQARARQSLYLPSHVEYFLSTCLFYKKHYSSWTHRSFRVLKFSKILFHAVLYAILNMVTGFMVPAFRRRLSIHGYLLLWHLFPAPKRRIKR